MQKSPNVLRTLSRRWHAAVETANEPKMKRHYAGHVVYPTTLAGRLEPPEASKGEARIGFPGPRCDRRAGVLVLEDDDVCRDVIRNVLRTAGFEVICASSFDQAVSRVEDGTDFDIALVDVKMPHGTPHGISFARLAQTRLPSLKIIFMSSHLSSDDLKLIDEDEAFLCKPFAPHQLLELVARAGA
jgi:CheY-like chemotaxis protein